MVKKKKTPKTKEKKWNWGKYIIYKYKGVWGEQNVISWVPNTDTVNEWSIKKFKSLTFQTGPDHMRKFESCSWRVCALF